MKQQTLFESTLEDAMTIDDVVRLLNVSSASVRNWIKTGYLEKIGRTSVTRKSFCDFQANVLGKEKLNQRANKSLKDQHDQTELRSLILEKIESPETQDENLSEIYESGLSESFKNREGIFYTPPDIVKSFFDCLPNDCSDLTFCDPCCGTGNFLIEALRRGFKPSNVYGFDVDETALAIAKQRLAGFEKGHESEIEEKNFLDYASREKKRFDVIFTNPPWGKKLSKLEKDSLVKLPRGCRSRDTSTIFFFGCLSSLRPSGYLGLLLQDAFFNIASYEAARQAALANRIVRLIDFGKPFKGLVTKAKGIVLRREEPDGKKLTSCAGPNGIGRISQSIFGKNPKSILNFTCSERDLLVIDHILSIEHDTLRGSARWGLGIVTGNNKKFCSAEFLSNHIPVFKGSDISRSGLKQPSAFIPRDFSQYQQVAPLSLYEAPEKLIYKFISSEIVFVHDVEQRFFLNSANMLILDRTFPLTHKQLCELLNSRLMTWLFQKLFDTHKILRGDLEVLPIFVDYFKENQIFSEENFLNYLSLEKESSGAYRIKG